MTVEFGILGPLEVVKDGAPARLGGPLERTVLALLLLHANAAVSRERLIDELWPTGPPESAVNVLQTYVSHLRKALPPERLVTYPPGYLLRVEPGELDLHRFERLLEAGRRSLGAGDAAGALDALRQALELWRGAPLRDVVQDGFARSEAARLEELRLAALEVRIDADLALGRHAEAIAELETLTKEQPLRERFRAQLMLALYRSGRQPEALAVYREVRSRLADELGIEPSQALRELEGAILRQDHELAAPVESADFGRRRTLLVASLDEAGFEPLLSIGESLARHQDGDLLVVRLVPDADELATAARAASSRRAALAASGLAARAVAFTSTEPAADVLRAAADADAVFALVGAIGGIDDDGRLDDEVAELLASAPCDAAVVVAAPPFADGDAEAPVLVPFGGSEHEWAAAEIAAWIAKAEGRPLRLVGTAATLDAGRRDASRLLASVALLVQHVADVDAEPALAPAGELAGFAVGARVVLLGLPDGWEDRGIGRTRAELVRNAQAPVALVHGGIRPGVLAQAEGLTRFTWTVSSSSVQMSGSGDSVASRRR